MKESTSQLLHERSMVKLHSVCRLALSRAFPHSFDLNTAGSRFEVSQRFLEYPNARVWCIKVSRD